MQHHKKEIESISQSIIDLQEVATPKAIEASEEARQGAEPELTDLMRPDAFEYHLNDYLQDEREKLNRGERDDPLCDCSRPTCPVKHAKLPPQVEQYDDLLEGIRNYQRTHVGSARGLSEARDSFIDRCADVKTTLRKSLAAIQMTEQADEQPDEAASA